jgi:flagellar biogenesis protein FliO
MSGGAAAMLIFILAIIGFTGWILRYSLKTEVKEIDENKKL